MPTARGVEFLTIAAIRQSKDKRVTQYLFNEKQRIYTFRSATTTTAERSAERLEEAFEKNLPVRARLDERRGFIRRVTHATKKQVSEFERGRVLLKRPERPRRIDVSKIDPTTFNIVDAYLKVPVFGRCKRVVRSYKIAKKIFDYCAAQSCHLPGPYSISPCIPFQYVGDGCYARAHKMRWIITTKYRYCCEKVFSFAIDNGDQLAVHANKWGGCCAWWWYHVAPLIRVRVKWARLNDLKADLAMVIDPSMFDQPVLLSTWLSAQEDPYCNAGAQVSMYSIQPGSAYQPANGQGTAFTTDPSYTATDWTLNDYQHSSGCGP